MPLGHWEPKARVIQRYPLKFKGALCEIEVRLNALIVHCALYEGSPTLWLLELPPKSLEEDGSARERRMFVQVRDGEEFPGAYDYVGTLVREGGVSHILEIKL